MVVSLDDAKLYLRVTGDEEDTLITQLLLTAEEVCEGILRFPLTEFAEVPETVKQAVLYMTANFYENREAADSKEILNVAARLLFSYRQNGW